MWLWGMSGGWCGQAFGLPLAIVSAFDPALHLAQILSACSGQFSWCHPCPLCSSVEVTCFLYLVKIRSDTFEVGYEKYSGNAMCHTLHSGPAPFGLVCCVQNELQVTICQFTSLVHFDIYFLFRVNENDEPTEIMVISDQFLATCRGLQQILACRNWADIRCSVLPHHLPGTEKHIKLVLFREPFKWREWNSPCSSR